MSEHDPPSASPRAAPSKEDTFDARETGRGGLVILLAKGIFIVSGFLQQVLLKGILGLGNYGLFSPSMTAANIVNNVVVGSSVQTASREIASATGEHQAHALRSILRVHIPMAVLLGGAFFFVAPLLARVVSTPVATLQVLSLVVVAYTIYAPLVGSLNGRRRFRSQASLDMAFAGLRTVGLVLGAYLAVRSRPESGPTGAAFGFAGAAVVIVLLATRSAGTGQLLDSEPLSARMYLARLWPLGASQLLTNLLMQADLLLFAAFLRHRPIDHGLVSEEWVGVYRACQLFAFLPYQLLVSVSQVLFPLVAKLQSDGNSEEVRRLVGQGMRFTAILAGLLVAEIFTLRLPLLALAYGKVVSEAGYTGLGILVCAQGAFAVFAISTSVLASLGRERTTAKVSALALGCVLIGCVSAGILVRGSAGDLLVYFTSAVLLGLLVALAIVGTRVWKHARAFVPWRTGVRVVLALFVTGTLATKLPGGDPHMLSAGLPILKTLGVVVSHGLVAAVLYLGLLTALRELGRGDLDWMVRVVRKKQGRK